MITLFAIVFLSTSAANGDEIRFKNTTLRGTVSGVNAKGVTFQTGYGEIVVPFGDIETLTTDKPRYVVHGDVGGTQGRILGVEDGALIVGESLDTASRIPGATIRNVDNLENLKDLGKRLRNKFRYWSASLDAGLTYSDKTTDEVDFNLAVKVERLKKPYRFVARVGYIFSQDNPAGEKSSKSDNELRGFVKAERDLTEKLFLLTSHDLEYDEIDRISLRWISVLGPGIRIVDTDKRKLQLEIGPGYHYERNFGGGSNDYATAYFGFEGKTTFSFGSTLETRMVYTPSVNDWTGDYVILSEISLRVPIEKYISLRISIADTYDNTPDPDAQRNELKTIVSLSFVF